jgi:hypothetical protein
MPRAESDALRKLVDATAALVQRSQTPAIPAPGAPVSVPAGGGILPTPPPART